MQKNIGTHDNFWFDYYETYDYADLTFTYWENDPWYGKGEQCIMLTENDITEMIDYLTEIRNAIRGDRSSGWKVAGTK